MFQQVLIHEFVQSHLDVRTDNLGKTRGRISTPVLSQTRRQTDDSVQVRGKHFPLRRNPRRKCSLCAYKFSEISGKRIKTRINDYCEKCQKNICKTVLRHLALQVTCRDILIFFKKMFLYSFNV